MRFLAIALAGVAGAFVLAVLAAQLLARIAETTLPAWSWSLLIGLLALAMTIRWLPVWWWPWPLLLPMAIFWAPSVSPVWTALVLAGLALLQWNAWQERVPLYHSGAGTHRALGDWLQDQPFARIVDLGCGWGGPLRSLGRRFPARAFVGVESAPLNWLVARWRCRNLPNVQIRLGNFWSCPLGDHDLALCFLSTEPMARLWAKASGEMRPGSVLASVEFEVPGVPPEQVLNGGNRPIHCYRIPPHTDRTPPDSRINE
ncbi:MAG: class I SAM-dependent methyltransferase [Halothiobacillaceae bacterium]